jgi:hypothetical protein
VFVASGPLLALFSRRWTGEFFVFVFIFVAVFVFVESRYILEGVGFFS